MSSQQLVLVEETDHHRGLGTAFIRVIGPYMHLTGPRIEAAVGSPGKLPGHAGGGETGGLGGHASGRVRFGAGGAADVKCFRRSNEPRSRAWAAYT
jgi:hypothetical protein